MRRQHSNVWLAAIAASCTLHPAAADFRERLHEFDLNDYALGGGVSISENVYVGAPDGSTYYPVLAQLEPAAFSDDLFFSRDGGYGVRWLPSPRWEIGGLARVQTLGFVAGDSPALAEMPDRPPTLEVGATVGWRGAGVHVDWSSFADAFRHQTGASHLLRLSWPRRLERGYVIPELGLRRYTRSFVDYYYGVGPVAATPARPAYDGVAATGWSAAVAWGMRVKSAWLLTGKLGIEDYGSGISASPIVDDGDRSFLSLQISYDRPQFRAPGEPAFRAGGARPGVELLLGLADVDAESWLTGSDSGESGGADSELLYLDAAFRIPPHLIEVGLFNALHDARRRPTQNQRAEAELRDINVGYAFGLLDDAQKSVDVGAGLNVSELSIDFAAPEAADVSRRSKFPLPYLGIAAEARFERKLTANARAQWFLLDYDGYTGSRLFFTAGVSHRTFRRVAFGLAYVFNRLSLESDEGAGGRLDFDYQGPMLTVSGFF